MLRFMDRLRMSMEGVFIALDAMRANKVRAGLTILGVAVGVFVVVVISAAVHGINESVAQQFQAAGPTTFFVQRYPIVFENCHDSGDSCKWRSNPSLTFAEADLLKGLESVGEVAIQQGWGASVKYRDRELPNVNILGITANWPQINPPKMIAGRVFTEQESRAAASVVVINTTAAERLFGDEDAIGKVINVTAIQGAQRGGPFTVIGVFKDEASFLQGGERPRVVTSVYALTRKVGALTRWVAFVIKPAANARQDVTIDEVTAALRGVRGLRPGRESNFAIITQDKLFDVYNKVFGMFFLVMISLSSVGLLVGGVGVVAIMMISVTERTREIGVRKALGATRLIILWQFLVEAVTLTATGAMIGLALGWAVALLVRNTTPVAASVPPLAVVAALGASAFTGIVFGMLPAVRASRLDPVTALRHE
ncbi:MAG: ABC transporter permease [Gemmatimonadetes bacterium]|nr:ABC transporter permease [Gemmatimonadota bacterium]MBI3567008.1 ABC transporter permease [Gemmatimonadota bacterium]